MYQLGRIKYPSKKFCKDYYKKELERYLKENETIIEEGDEFFRYLKYLVENHPKYEEWNCDVTKFYLKRAPGGKGVELECYCEPGGWHIFSWTKCIDGEKTEAGRLSAAMRKSIRYQTELFRKSWTIETCVLCNCNLQDTENHVDHYPMKFRQLRNNFLEQTKHPVPKTFGPNETFLECDKEFETEWNEYHKQNAGFRILCAKCNTKLR